MVGVFRGRRSSGRLLGLCLAFGRVRCQSVRRPGLVLLLSGSAACGIRDPKGHAGASRSLDHWVLVLGFPFPIPSLPGEAGVGIFFTGLTEV